MDRLVEKDEFDEIVEFETRSLCPIDAACFHLILWRADEMAWLNGDHQMVLERVLPWYLGERSSDCAERLMNSPLRVWLITLSF